MAYGQPLRRSALQHLPLQLIMLLVALAELGPPLSQADASAAAAAAGLLGRQRRGCAADLAVIGEAAARETNSSVPSGQHVHMCSLHKHKRHAKQPRCQEVNRQADRAQAATAAAVAAVPAAGSLQTDLGRCGAAVASIWRRLDRARRLIPLLVGLGSGAPSPCGGCAAWAPFDGIGEAASPACMLAGPVTAAGQGRP